MSAEPHPNVDWLRQNTSWHLWSDDFFFTSGLERAFEAVCTAIAPAYNLARMFVVPCDWDLCFSRYGDGIRFILNKELATFDSDGLTRLVVEAHRRCVRTTICPWPGGFGTDMEESKALLKKMRKRSAKNYRDEFGVELGPVPLWHWSALALCAFPRDLDADTRHGGHPRLTRLEQRCATARLRDAEP